MPDPELPSALSAFDHEMTLGYTTDDDGVHLFCAVAGCGGDINLGHNAKAEDVYSAIIEHQRSIATESDVELLRQALWAIDYLFDQQAMKDDGPRPVRDKIEERLKLEGD